MKKTYTLLTCLGIILTLISHYYLLNHSIIRFHENPIVELLLSIKVHTGLSLSEKSLAILDIFLLLFAGSASGHLLSQLIGLRECYLKNCPRWFFLIPHGYILFCCFALYKLEYLQVFHIPISSPFVFSYLFLAKHLYLVATLFTWLYLVKKPTPQIH